MTRWVTRAACRGTHPEVFFPPDGPGSSLAAKAICRGCPVKVECAEDALADPNRYGVWGGLTALDRERIRAGRTSTGRRVLPRDDVLFAMEESPEEIAEMFGVRVVHVKRRLRNRLEDAS